MGVFFNIVGVFVIIMGVFIIITGAFSIFDFLYNMRIHHDFLLTFIETV